MILQISPQTLKRDSQLYQLFLSGSGKSQAQTILAPIYQFSKESPRDVASRISRTKDPVYRFEENLRRQTYTGYNSQGISTQNS